MKIEEAPEKVRTFVLGVHRGDRRLDAVKQTQNEHRQNPADLDRNAPAADKGRHQWDRTAAGHGIVLHICVGLGHDSWQPAQDDRSCRGSLSILFLSTAPDTFDQAVADVRCQENRCWTHSLWVDWTTATPCVRASMKACWTSCSISRMRLLDLSRTHGNTIISLLFFEICTGSQFVKESSSSWRPWSTNVSTVLSILPCRGLHTAVCHSWLAAPGIGWQIGTTCSKNTNCDFWPAGFRGGRPGGLEFSAPCSKRTDSLV